MGIVGVVGEPGQLREVAGHGETVAPPRRIWVGAANCCWTPSPTPITALIRVAGRRWTVKSQFQTAPSRAGSSTIISCASGPGGEDVTKPPPDAATTNDE